MEIPQGNVTAYVIILGQQKLKVDSFQIWQYQSIIYSSTTIFYKRTLPVSLSGTRMICDDDHRLTHTHTHAVSP